MKIVDTHAHMCDPAFAPDLPEVLSRAYEKGVRAIIAVSEDREDGLRTVELAKQYPIIKAALGLFPTYLDMEAAGEVISQIRREHERVMAIGEVGLDFWKVKEASEREIQVEIFRRFIELSRELDLPLNVHSRSAGRQAVAMLLEHGARKVQLHAFDGKASVAMPAVEAGFFFSIPPSVVRSRQKQKLVKSLPRCH